MQYSVTNLTDEELDEISTYTGLDIVMQYPLDSTPIIFFSRSSRGVVKFVTVLKDAPIGSESVCKWRGSLL